MNVDAYASSHDIVFNYRKSTGVLFSPKNFKLSKPPFLLLGLGKVKFVDRVKYQGIIMNQARRFVEIFGGVQLNNHNFFGEISRILFALFVQRRLCLQYSYVAVAHLMVFFFVFFRCEPFRK